MLTHTAISMQFVDMTSRCVSYAATANGAPPGILPVSVHAARASYTTGTTSGVDPVGNICTQIRRASLGDSDMLQQGFYGSVGCPAPIQKIKRMRSTRSSGFLMSLVINLFRTNR
jgi:hypothetical protein